MLYQYKYIHTCIGSSIHISLYIQDSLSSYRHTYFIQTYLFIHTLYKHPLQDTPYTSFFTYFIYDTILSRILYAFIFIHTVYKYTLHSIQTYLFTHTCTHCIWNVIQSYPPLSLSLYMSKKVYLYTYTYMEYRILSGVPYSRWSTVF